MKMSRITVIIVLVLFSIVAKGQSIVFAYDDSGNRVSRVLYVEQLKSLIIDFPVQENILDDITEANPSILVYPNPSRSNVFLEIKELNQEPAISYTLYDLYGAILIQEENGLPFNSLDITTLTHGIYILRVKIDNKTFDYKVVKAY